MAEQMLIQYPAQGHYTYAMYCWIAEKNIEKAAQELKQSLASEIVDNELLIEIGLTTGRLANQWGYQFLNKKVYDKSHNYFEWAIEVSPERANPYDSMVDYYTAVAKFDSALLYYEKALSIDPDFSASLYNKGSSLEKLGKEKLAVDIYNKVIEKDPSSQYAKSAHERLTILESKMKETQ